MKNVYLILAIIGFIIPNILVFQESLDTGNILLWTDPMATINAMFANRISTIFALDLFVVVLVFIIWSHFEAKKYNIKRVWILWIATMMFGLATTFPLFLYFRERS